MPATEITVWNWLLAEAPTLTGIARVVKGFPSLTRPALTAPSVAVVMGDLARDERGAKGIGSRVPYSAAWLLFVFARDEEEKITTIKRLREWAQTTQYIDPAGDGSRVRVTLRAGERHVPQSDTELERYAYVLVLETEL